MAMVWEKGHRLFGGRYIVQKKLGQGGFGITYLVKDKKGQLFVVKTLKDEVMTEPEFEEYRDKYLRDFTIEALKLAVCSHRHIVRVKNHFSQGPLPCLVMEYIKGQDLWRRLKCNGPLPEAEATRYIRQIGDALTLVHENGLLHRDLKPHNIMVRTAAKQQENGEAVLIDFGIAREFIPDLTQTHSAVLTPGFAPLEQYDEQARRGEFSDVYALAATYYCLVTGKLPPPAFMRVVRDTLIPPQDINSQISDAVSQAILVGLQLHSQNRPQSMLEWLELLSGEEEGITSNDKSAGNCSVIVENAALTTKTSGGRIILPTTEDGSVKLDVVEELNLEQKVDYRHLRDLLKAGKWKEADLETYRCMLKMAGREKNGYFYNKDIDNFFCQELRAIDCLWVQYSNGRFGFSVQKRIYQELGGTRQYDNKIWRAFGDRVGWREGKKWLNYNDLRREKNFGVTLLSRLPWISPDDGNLPRGHLPWPPPGGGSHGCGWVHIWLRLLSRAETCNL